MRPALRLIRGPEDAEEVAAEWLRWMGFDDAESTGRGKDRGVDVLGEDVAAQVKMEGRKSTGPQVQQLQGAAAFFGRSQTAFFSLKGYTPDAMSFAEVVGMALFHFDLQGEPEASNDSAARWVECAENRVDEDYDPANHTLYQDHFALPAGYATEFGDHEPRLADRMRPLDWPLDPDTGRYPTAWTVAGTWPFDTAEWDWLEFTSHHAIREAIEFRLRLEPRPRMLFGGLVNAVGWTWLVGEVPCRPPLRLFIIETAPLPSSGEPFDLSYGMTPPVMGYCTSIEAALAFTQPWRDASALDDRVKLVANAREAEAAAYRCATDDVRPFPLVSEDVSNISGMFLDSLERMSVTLAEGTGTVGGLLQAAAMQNFAGESEDLFKEREDAPAGRLSVEIHIPLARKLTTGLDGEPDVWFRRVETFLAQMEAAGELEVYDEGQEDQGEYVFFITGAAESDLMRSASLVADLPLLPAGAYAVVTHDGCAEIGMGQRVELPV